MVHSRGACPTTTTCASRRPTSAGTGALRSRPPASTAKCRSRPTALPSSPVRRAGLLVNPHKAVALARRSAL